MGSIVFPPGVLADQLHELVGHKAGLAASLPDLKEFLSGTTHVDLLTDSEESAIRLRAEDFDDLYYTVLHRVGHTEVKSRGILDVVDLGLKQAEKYGLEFAEKLSDIHHREYWKILESRKPNDHTAIDPLPILQAARAELGKKGEAAMVELLLTMNAAVSLSPHSMQRFIEWQDVIPLDELFKRTKGKVAHGTYLDQRLIDFLSVNQGKLGEIHWRKFEELTAEHFHRLGYGVELGPGQNDDGVDLRLLTPDLGDGTKRDLQIVQCKRTAGKVDKLVVKGLSADVQHAGAALGVLVTSADLTPGAHATILQRGYPIEAVNGEKVGEWITAMRTPGTGIVRV
ncbi:MAG: restriction endonuclease [Burkholderiales bacterium]|nr:restriction endonuclease [Betaproteobacteria bacterium]MDX2218242.1 restriction endonuclease [Burkholderiales bacterium]